VLMVDDGGGYDESPCSTLNRNRTAARQDLVS
jgi:hypothetical protein